MKRKVYIGVDIGTISIQIAVLYPTEHVSHYINRIQNNPFFFDPNITQFENHSYILSDYQRHYGDPYSCIDRMLHSLFQLFPQEEIDSLYFTGSIGK